MTLTYHLMSRLLVMLLVLVGGGGLLAYHDVQHETRELFDAQLARSARLILSLIEASRQTPDFSSIQLLLDQQPVAPGDDDDDAEDEAGARVNNEQEQLPRGHIYETRLGFQIWDHEGNLLLKSLNLPISPISNDEQGYSERHFNGHDWRLFNLMSEDGRYRCITAERIDIRNELVGKISSDLGLLFLLMIPVLALTVRFALSNGLSTLNRLSAQIRQRGAKRLDRIPSGPAPDEIETISSALNQLLERLKNALEREKRITSDAAHELRTPLAAVRLHAQLANSAESPADLKHSLDQVLQGIERSTHLVEQILALARLEPDSIGYELKPIRLDAVVIDEIAQLTPLAQLNNIEMALSENSQPLIEGEDAALRLLIRNLLNNALNYTQSGGQVDVMVQTRQQQPCLVIQDNGPGIPAELRERVMERFYRIKHESPGCGIGLSIVNRAVVLLGASFELADSSHHSGLRATVCFKAATKSPD